MRLLLHLCCGPCAVGALAWAQERLGRQEMAGLFYNPNIHPEAEYARRLASAQRAAQALDLPLVIAGDQDCLVDYLRQIAFRETDRCRVCYAMRLAYAAKEAARQGFDAFSTSLLISPYQDQEALGLVGKALSRLFGPDFIFDDMRPFYRPSRQRAREMGLYMQHYCGCVFSELERLRSRLRRKNAKHAPPAQLPAEETQDLGFGLTALDTDAARLALPMSDARPFTLAGLDPEATARLLSSVAQSVGQP